MAEIHPAARKHGVADADLRHAIEHALVIADSHEDHKVLYLGPDRAGNLLEVIAIARVNEVVLVIHGMRMRPTHEPLLRGLGDGDD